jgi:hypothetical protein
VHEGQWSERAGARLLKPLRQVIEPIHQAFKGQLDLERHGGKSPAGVIARVLSRVLALTAAIWLNDKTGQPVKRSLTATTPLGFNHLADSVAEPAARLLAEAPSTGRTAAANPTALATPGTAPPPETSPSVRPE